MITERKVNQIIDGAEFFTDKLIEKYYKTFLGDRLEEGENGELYSQEGRQVTGPGEEVRSIDQYAPGG